MSTFSRVLWSVLSNPITMGGTTFCVYQSLQSSDSSLDTAPWKSMLRRFHKVAHAAVTNNFKPSVPWINDWDKKPLSGSTSTDGSPAASGDVDSKFTRHLLLIRHGEYVYSSSDENCKLTKLGREQATFTGRRLKEMELPYTRLIYSSMTRAIETAENILPFFPGLPAISCDLLREGAPYPPEPPLPSYSPSADAFFRDGARIESAFRRYFYRAPPDQKKDTYEIIVCHANVIRYFVCRALQFPPEAWLRFSLDHCSITWVSIRPNGRVAVRFIGSSGHIPQEKITVR